MMGPATLAFCLMLAIGTGALTTLRALRLAPSIAMLSGLAATLGAAAAILLGTAIPVSFAAWSIIMVMLLASLAVFDWHTMTVPDVLTWPLILLGCAHAALNLPSPLLALMAPFAIIALAAGLAMFLPERLRAMIGDGDVLLIAGATAWLGPFVLVDFLTLTAIFALLLCVCRSPAVTTEGDLCTTPGIALAPASAVAQGIIWFHGPIL